MATTRTGKLSAGNVGWLAIHPRPIALSATKLLLAVSVPAELSTAVLANVQRLWRSVLFALVCCASVGATFLLHLERHKDLAAHRAFSVRMYPVTMFVAMAL